VERVRDAQAPRPRPCRRKCLEQRVDGVARPGHDDLAGRVDRGDLDVRARAERLAYALFGGEDRRHGAALRERPHEAAASGHEPGAVLGLEDAGERRCGIRADAVPEQH
jgi:hypothetical protein